MLLTLVGSCLLGVVSTWWGGLVEGRFAVPGYYHWFTWMSRSSSGPSIVGFCLLSVALGAAVGLVLRRVVASIVVTAVLTLAVRFAVDAGRYLLAPVQEVVGSVRMAAPGAPDRMITVTTGHLPTVTPLESDVVQNGLLTNDGRRLPVPSDFVNILPDGALECPVTECKEQYQSIERAYTLFHPPGDEWVMHWTQAGLSLAVTAALLVFCAVWVRRVR